MTNLTVRIVIIAKFSYWGMFEAGFAVVAACLPTLQFLLRESAHKQIAQDVQKLFTYTREKMTWSSKD